jgi:hypothetical protein
LHQLANQFGTVGAEPRNDIIDVFDGKHDATSSVLGGALFGSALSAVGLRNFVSSTRRCPSGVRIIAMSDRTPSSPMRRSTERPSTCGSPLQDNVVVDDLAAAVAFFKELDLDQRPRLPSGDYRLRRSLSGSGRRD